MDPDDDEGKEQESDTFSLFFKKIDEHVQEVDVAWNGQIEKVCFPLRPDVTYLRDQTKKSFENSTDLSTTESRMKALIQVTPIFDQEMTQIYSMARLSKVYEFLHYHISTIKMCMYLLIVLLNLNIMMASYGGMPVVLTNTTETLKVVHYDSLGYETLRQDEDPPAYGHEASFKSFPGAEKQVYDFQDYDVNKSLILSRAFAWVNLLGRIQIHYFCSSVTHSKHQTLLENYEP